MRTTHLFVLKNIDETAKQQLEINYQAVVSFLIYYKDVYLDKTDNGFIITTLNKDSAYNDFFAYLRDYFKNSMYSCDISDFVNSTIAAKKKDSDEENIFIDSHTKSSR